ncbi:MAG: family 16 glycosylhydrolase, partial [Rikenellaceae bacterium]
MNRVLSIAAVLLLSSLCVESMAEVATEAAGTTKARKFYTDTVDFSNKPKHRSDKFPLSDQKNRGGWVKVESACDEFNGEGIDEQRWFDYNPGWKGRQPTQFHPANVAVEGGNAVFSINKHGDDKLLEGYTHSSGFLVSKTKYKYGYFEARLKCNNSPWVAGFWITGSDKDHWIEIDICENCPGAE